MPDNKNFQEVAFLQLLEKYSIEIPEIQRDYAQGRADEKTKEVRANFLDRLFEALTIQTDNPLVLDFVYGKESDDRTIFIPLDGQQRLTTLFLLHWYVCPENEIALLQNAVGISRLTYKTRISSKDFCKELAHHHRAVIIKDEKTTQTISKIIINQAWFMWSWKKDPTIEAMLNMLDDIEEKIKYSKTNESTIWAALKKGRVGFNLLSITKFSMEDKLYVTMNARGKELSDFDILKSTLEEQMRKLGKNISDSVQEKWYKNIDNYWFNIFWNKIVKNKIVNDQDENIKIVRLAEESYLRFLSRLIVFYLFLNDVTSTEIKEYKGFLPIILLNENINKEFDISSIRRFSVQGELAKQNKILSIMPFLCKTSFFSEEFYVYIETIIDSFIFNNFTQEGSELIDNVLFEDDNKTLFERFIDESIGFNTRIQFYSLILFFKYNNIENVRTDKTLRSELSEWMRIIRNLTTNSNVNYYNNYEDFSKSLSSLVLLVDTIYGEKKYHSVLDYFRSNEKLEGFAPFQVDEEKIKVGLFNKPGWERAIKKAENLPYFTGQISFLFDWSDTDGKHNLNDFKTYFEKASYLFEANGLIPDIHQNKKYSLRNAMLCFNKQYPINGWLIRDTAKDRDNSWKNYLRKKENNQGLKCFLKNWNITKPITEYCEKIIGDVHPNDWRKYFIERPEIYNCLNEQYIKFWDESEGEVALLNKIEWSRTRHKELRTFYWHLKYKKDDVDKYFDSHDGIEHFDAVFYSNKEEYVSVNYNKENHQYIIRTPLDKFNSIQGMKYNDDNRCWERVFPTSEYEKVEELLDKIISKRPML